MSMRDRARETAARTDRELSAQELKLLLDTDIDVEKLSPSITSHDLYKELVQIVSQATASNNNVALLELRLRSLGEEGLTLTHKIIDAIR